MFGQTIRVRPFNKLHIVVILLVGFLICYHLLPGLLRGREVPHGAMIIKDRGIKFTPSGRGFIVEGKEKRILSGALHYFRVVPAYWEDRLKKLKAAGLNTVETYVPWNMHEPLPGKYDFSGILDIRQYILLAQSLGLHVIVRPGPYICSEWDLGGLPTWLLHDPKMVLRSTYLNYMNAVESYFEKLFAILTPLQSINGGPIIAFQVENEFGSYVDITKVKEGREYLTLLCKLMKRLGVKELLFTSDGQDKLDLALRLRPSNDVMLTVNFMSDRNGLKNLSRIQPDKPVMVMEFWSGWFDHWMETHLGRDQTPVELAFKTRTILNAGGSVNYYMFHGGTNFGFMNGANWGDPMRTLYQPTITSYDYGAPLTENGDVTDKYLRIRETLELQVPDSLAVFPLPPIPENIPTTSYGIAKLTLFLPILRTLQYLPEPHLSDHPVAMEFLSLNGCGQGRGFALYRTMISSRDNKVIIHSLKDYGVAMVDSKPIKKLSFFDTDSFVLEKQEEQEDQKVLDILVENAGHVNYGYLESRKGILGKVETDHGEVKKWKTYSLEFDQSFIEKIDSGGMWQRTPSAYNTGPSLFKGTFTIEDSPEDTFIDMKGWGKGVVFINGVNMGRYWKVGPQRTLYIPAPILKRGINKVMIFEMYSPKEQQTIEFLDHSILDNKYIHSVLDQY